MVLSWDDYYMSIVYLAAMKSKDKSSHLGAVIVGSNNEIRSIGYNGLPRFVDDTIDDRNKRPEKYYWYEHAERNAIYNALLSHTSIDGCTMYTNGIPCSDCGRAIIQCGIKEVVVDSDWNNNNPRWDESCDRTSQMFAEAGVILRSINYKPIKINKYINGKYL